MRLAATIMVIAWTVLVVPVWLLGMAFAGEILFLADWKGEFDFAWKVAAMYLPPLLFVAVYLAGRRAPKQRNRNAAD